VLARRMGARGGLSISALDEPRWMRLGRGKAGFLEAGSIPIPNEPGFLVAPRSMGVHRRRPVRVMECRCEPLLSCGGSFFSAASSRGSYSVSAPNALPDIANV
jgi:hypothetical protein